MCTTTLNTSALLSFATSFCDVLESVDLDGLSDSQLSRLETTTQQAADLVLEACIDAGHDLPEHRRLFELDDRLFDEMVLRHEVRDGWNFEALHDALDMSHCCA